MRVWGFICYDLFVYLRGSLFGWFFNTNICSQNKVTAFEGNAYRGILGKSVHEGTGEVFAFT